MSGSKLTDQCPSAIFSEGLIAALGREFDRAEIPDGAH